MTARTNALRPAFRITSCGILVVLFAALSLGQTNSYQRTFPQSKATVEKALTGLQSSMAGHLPVLEGFAKAGEHPLDHYQRAYYQSTAQVSATPSGGSIVRITTKVTAWYADPVASHSGYQLLTSNGRLESDLLDQLSELLAKGPTGSGTPAPSTAAAPQQSSEPTASSGPTAAQPSVAQPSISAPSPKFPETNRTFSSSLSQGLASARNGAEPSVPAGAEKSKSPSQAEAENLEAILKNTAHPKNLVAVKKSGTPVVSSPSLTAKPQFLASLHDEFEMLDFNADWVHVRISGLSRGWIWRNSVEMPDGIRDTDVPAAAALTPAADLFRVAREEASPFPGDWAPLKNKNVKIISVQKVDGNAKDTGAKARLEYAKFLFEKAYKEMGQKPQDLAGIVVIFDSADGGMIAATLATLQQWKVGKLSDSAFWHQCFFDPPELSDSPGSSASQ